MNCELCGKSFTSKYSLEYHITHNVCTKHIVKCSKCGKTLSSTSLPYHLKNNVCAKQKEKFKLKLKTKQTYDHMSKDEIINQLEHELSKMVGKYESLKENPQNINTNNNIIIFPKEFGKEDMDLIKNKLGDILGPMIKNHPRKSIPILFNKIHNNDQLPEYHNVYISSERSNYAMVSDGKSFKYKPKKSIIDQIIEDKRSLLNQYIDDNGDQLGEKVLSKYEKYQDEIDDNSTFRKELEVEIGGLLLDMKSVIANDEKTRKLLDKVNEGQYELDPN